MHVLHREDNPHDAELVRDLLTLEWPKLAITLVDTKVRFVAGLQAGGCDVIISDFCLPRFNGLDALTLARAEPRENLSPHRA